MKQLITIIVLVFIAATSLFAQKRQFGERLDKKDYDRLSPMAFSKDIVMQSSVNLKQYCPTPIEQQGGICFAYASGYTGRTILYNITVNETVTPDKNIFSFGFLVLLAKNAGSLPNNCKGGSSVALACDNMEKYGAVPFASLKEYCPPKNTLTAAMKEEALKYKVVAEKLYEQCTSPEEKILQIKKALADSTPVMFGLDVPPSFSKKNALPNRDLWQLSAVDKRNLKCSRSVHAMCIVGYDDDRYGGTFEIVNSWGTDWKNQGFTYITYQDLALIARYAVRIKNIGGLSNE